MKVKRSGMLTKLLILILLVATVTTYLNLRKELRTLTAEQTQWERRNEKQSQENAALAAAIEQKDDPEQIAAVARERLGWVAPGEIVFYDSGN